MAKSNMVKSLEKQFKDLQKEWQKTVESNAKKQPKYLKEGDKDWKTPCDNCDALPTVHPTGLCGPCCFGEAETINGNW